MILDLVDEPGGDITFALQDPEGDGNPFGVGFAVRDSTIDMGAFDPDYVALSYVNDGGTILRTRNRLTMIRCVLRVSDPDLANVRDAIEYLGRILAAGGGFVAFSPDGIVPTRYIPFEPSPSLQMFIGQQAALELVNRERVVFPEVPIVINRQPWAVGAEQLALVNALANGTLLNDYDGTANRPDGFAWDSTTGITGESIDDDIADWGYTFTIANNAAHNLQQSTASGTAAPGDVWTGSFYAKVDAVAGTPQVRVVVRFLDSGGTPVGSDASGTLTTLTTLWQRLEVTTAAAPASTSRVRISLQIDNVDATSVVVRFRNAQLEEAASASPFRVGAQAVTFNPASTALPRRLMVYVDGGAPTTGRLTFTADAATLGEVAVYRQARDAIAFAKQSSHRQLESGTLGTGTTSVSDSNASGGNTAEVDYPATTPAFRSAASADIDATSSIVVAKPSGVVAGDVLVAAMAFRRTSESGGGSGQTISLSPSGWVLAGTRSGTSLPTLSVYYKVASAGEPSTYTWIADRSVQGRVWCGAYENIDTLIPLDQFAAQNGGFGGDTTADISSITTTRDVNMVIEITGRGNDVSATVTPPTGTTPTYTEREDDEFDTGGNTIAFIGLEVADGTLATAGATGAKVSTATDGGTWLTAHMSLNRLPSAFEERVRQTWTPLLPGDYDVWLHYYPTAVSVQRLECEWAPVASPSEWYSFGEFVIDTTDAAAFAYAYRNLGRIHIPPEWPLDTLTIRVSSGMDVDLPANLRLDFIDLVPVNEVVGTLTARGTVANGAKLSADPDTSQVFHLNATSELIAIGTAAGAIPVPLEPGLNLLTIVAREDVADGFVDRAAVLTAAPTVAVDVTPRYRT